MHDRAISFHVVDGGTIINICLLNNGLQVIIFILYDLASWDDHHLYNLAKATSKTVHDDAARGTRTDKIKELAWRLNLEFGNETKPLVLNDLHSIISDMGVKLSKSTIQDKVRKYLQSSQHTVSVCVKVSLQFLFH